MSFQQIMLLAIDWQLVLRWTIPGIILLFFAVFFIILPVLIFLAALFSTARVPTFPPLKDSDPLPNIPCSTPP